MSLGGPIFDTEKLDWLNGKYIREDLSDAQFAERYGAWAFSSDKVAKIVPLLKQRVERFSDVAGLGGFFLSGLLDIDMDDFAHKTLDAQLQAKILQFSLWRLEQLQHWQRDNIEDTLQSLSNSLQLKIRDFLFPLFVAISGKAVSTSVIESIQILGMDICRARMRHAIAVLGGISKKQAKLLEREFRDLS